MPNQPLIEKFLNISSPIQHRMNKDIMSNNPEYDTIDFK